MLLSALTVSFLCFAPAVPQDEIYLVNGKVMQVERVTSETYKEVLYKLRGASEGRKPADQVREVVHNLGSAVLDDYAQGLELMDAADFTGAIQIFNDVLSDDRLLEKARWKWVRQHAFFRQLRCAASLGDHAGVQEIADMLLEAVPDTFFYAPALMMKAEALAMDGNAEGARQVYRELDDAVVTKGLPQRWAREAELGLVLLDDSLKGKALRTKLEQLVNKNAGEYPTVASRARVEIGNSMIAEGDYTSAEVFFQKIVDEGGADDRTEAAAYSGLGDCAYQKALLAEDKDPEAARQLFQDAAIHHLRVVTMHKDVVALVPRSIYYSGEVFKRTEGLSSPRARQMLTRADRNYPRSPWTDRLYKTLNIRR